MGLFFVIAAVVDTSKKNSIVLAVLPVSQFPLSIALSRFVSFLIGFSLCLVLAVEFYWCVGVRFAWEAEEQTWVVEFGEIRLP